MKLTLQTQLLPDKEQSAALKQTVERFNAACSWLAEQAFAARLSTKPLCTESAEVALRTESPIPG
jgi:hypothetical protein